MTAPLDVGVMDYFLNRDDVKSEMDLEIPGYYQNSDFIVSKFINLLTCLFLSSMFRE